MTMTTKHYAIPHEFAYNPNGLSWVPQKVMHVFIFEAGPYRENNKLRLTKCKRVWSMCETGRKTLVSAKRAKQIEKICKQTGVVCEVTREG